VSSSTVNAMTALRSSFNPVDFGSSSPTDEFTLRRLGLESHHLEVFTFFHPIINFEVDIQSIIDSTESPYKLHAPATPIRRRHSITSLSPSPKNKPPKKKAKLNFFLDTVDPDEMTHDLLHDYIMGKVESKWKDILDSPPGTYEQLKISLGKIGFSKYFVDGHFESVSALNRRFGKALKFGPGSRKKTPILI
jgi:hypothetical protein